MASIKSINRNAICSVEYFYVDQWTCLDGDSVLRKTGKRPLRFQFSARFFQKKNNLENS